jgi:hypothetical protein
VLVRDDGAGLDADFMITNFSRSEPLEEAITVLFCLIDDAYALLNPRTRCYEALKIVKLLIAT